MSSMDTLRIRDFISLARFNRPIGIYLLFWPTMWALWLAAENIPSVHNLIIFTLGVVFMRGAGCVINDYADRHFDRHVKRTCDRPVACGRISERAALAYFFTLVLPAFLLVLTTNSLTIGLSFAGLILASVYPFAKRYTHFPQVVLGAAFSWSMPMAFAAESNTLPWVVWLLFIANLLWTVAYDTQYAMVDRDDDLKIGIKSTAILFGEYDNRIVALLQLLTLVMLSITGVAASLNWLYFMALVMATCLFVYQQRLTKERGRTQCFSAFLSNHWIGAIVFVGIVLGRG